MIPPNKQPLLSIIIVTYNAERFISTALESLASRVNNLTEIIIVDGQSTDRTLEIVKKYNKFNSKVHSAKDCGIYDAMNKGVSISKGQFILFLGADDELVVNIDCLVPLLKHNDTVYYGDVILTPVEKIFGGQYNLTKLINRNICHQSIFYPRAAVVKYQFELKYELLSDYVLNIKLWSDNNYKFKYIDKVISKYSIEGLSSTRNDIRFKKDSFMLILKSFGFYGLLIKFLNPVVNFFKLYDSE